MIKEMRAGRDEIFEHLRSLLTENAVTLSQEVASQYIAGQQDAALKLLKQYDTTLGGVGIYRSGGKKLPEFIEHFPIPKFPCCMAVRQKAGDL
jgi:hypothetical protein